MNPAETILRRMATQAIVSTFSNWELVRVEEKEMRSETEILFELKCPVQSTVSDPAQFVTIYIQAR